MPIYQMTHGRRSCMRSFKPLEVYRLYAEERLAQRLLYQDLMVGQCTLCDEVVMAWMAVDKTLSATHYHPIKPRNHQLWLERTNTDLKEDNEGIMIILKGSLSVTGSILDPHCYKWRFARIPVQ